MNLNEQTYRIKQMMGVLSEHNKKSEEDRFTCQDCGNPDYDMYMVNDDIWDKYGNKTDTLCMGCLEKRMGRNLTKHDFSQYKNALCNIHNKKVNKLI